jgi:hypothetical protein
MAGAEPTAVDLVGQDVGADLGGRHGVLGAAHVYEGLASRRVRALHEGREELA